LTSLPWLVTFAICVAIGYAAFILALVVAGRAGAIKDVARFVPDCIVLVNRLLRDPRVPLGHKLLLGALIGYLAFPFDLVPDFIPVAGQLDDAIIVVLALRSVLRKSGGALLTEHWPGPERSLALVLRFAT
jgi:uncharacterized membrane protein YkvA (DUF1232 family)